MKTWSILVVTLTDACVDAIKLALLDVGTKITPHYSIKEKLCFSSIKEDCFGCVFLANIDHESEKSGTVAQQLENALAKRGVQFLTLAVTTIEGGTFETGNIKREVERKDLTMYRKPPVPEL